MDDDKRWDELFAKTPEAFWDRMANDIRALYDAGLITDLVDADFDDPPTPPTSDQHYTDAAQLRTWRQERG